MLKLNSDNLIYNTSNDVAMKVASMETQQSIGWLYLWS